MLFNRRQSTLSTIQLRLASLLKNSQDIIRLGRRSCLTISFTGWNQNAVVCDLLDNNAIIDNLHPLRIPLRSINDALQLSRVASSNINFNCKEISVTVRTITRSVTLRTFSTTEAEVHPDQDKITMSNLTFYDNILNPTTSIQATESFKDISTYLKLKIHTKQKIKEHTQVADRIEKCLGSRSVSSSQKLMLRKNKARGAYRLLLLLEHLDTLHYGEKCPYCLDAEKNLDTW